MREKIVELLKERDLSVEELSVLLNCNSKDFVRLNKEVNQLVSDRLAVFDDKNNKIRLNDFYQGEVVYSEGILSVIDGKMEYPVVNGEEYNLFAGDEILYELNRNEAICVSIIKRARIYVTGIIREGKRDFYFYSDDKFFKDYRIVNYKDFKLRRNYKVRCYISDYKNKLLKIDKVIGHINDNGVLEESVLLKYDIRKDFPRKVVKELENIDKTVYIGNRRDLRNKCFITIDGRDAKDFDDAVCIEKEETGYVLYVSIADVSNYVKENSELDKEALRRGTSIYYPGKVIPMLPEILSNDLCSLREGVDRYTLSVEMHIGYDGEISEYDLCESVICSKHRMTYDDVNRILEHDEYLLDKYSDIKQMIFDGYNLSRVIDKKRKQSGGINFESNEAVIVLNKDKVVDIKPRIQSKSEQMIEDFMIEANRVVAGHMFYLDLPMIYRNHDYPKADRIADFVKIVEDMDYHFRGNIYELESYVLNNCLKSFEGSVEYPLVSSLLLRCMAKAVYETGCTGHYGLGLKEYCHFTSPIRRYPDLIVHRMLRKYVFNVNSDYDKDNKKNVVIARDCNKAERVAVSIERAIDDIYKCIYMEDKISQRFEGVISYIGAHGFFVKLENTVEGFVGYEEAENDFRIGQKVKVIVSSVDKLRGNIDFVLYHKNRYERETEKRYF
ncbi:MAG: ribonuclease R family protein [Erysipelotrichaceae bacterium]